MGGAAWEGDECKSGPLPVTLYHTIVPTSGGAGHDEFKSGALERSPLCVYYQHIAVPDLYVEMIWKDIEMS